MKILILTFTLIFCNALCWGQNPVRIGLKDHGQTIAVKVGQTFTVTFELECVGCAQVWTPQGIDNLHIKLLSNQTQDRSCTQCTGGTATRVFTYKALKKGKIKMLYRYFTQSLGFKLDIRG